MDRKQSEVSQTNDIPNKDERTDILLRQVETTIGRDGSDKKE